MCVSCKVCTGERASPVKESQRLTNDPHGDLQLASPEPDAWPLEQNACMGAGEADRLCALVFDEALAMGLPRVAVHVHKVGPPVA